MTYDPYNGVPFDLRPTTADVAPLWRIVHFVKTAIMIRHDFHTAARIAGKIEKGLPSPIPPWESEFAKSFKPGAKTMAGLADEHERLRKDAQSEISQVRGNAKLARLLRENLWLLFPAVGFSASTGDVVQRLMKDKGKSVLQIFHPLGVEDNARLIGLLLRRPSGNSFYW